MQKYNISHIDGLSHDKYKQNLNNTFDFSGIPMMIGVSIYSFEALGLIFTIRNSVAQPEKSFGSIFRNINVIIVCLYIVFSVIGCIAFGKDINEIILFSLPNDNQTIQFFQIMYAITLITSYPIQLLPCFKIVEKQKRINDFIYKGHDLQNPQKDSCKVICRRLSIRTFVTLCICFIAFAIPRFAVFLNIIGAVAGTSLQFVLPIIMYLQTFKDQVKYITKMKLYFFFIIGVLGGLFSFIFSIIELSKSRDEN